MPTDTGGCGYCGGALAGREGPPEYAVCGACGSLNLRPARSGDNAHFEGDSSADRMDANDVARRGFLSDRLDALEAVQSSRGLLFEIGCATGRFLELARGRGWTVAGNEMSPQLAARARALNPQADISGGDILRATGLPFGRCAAVVALDVVEHVDDPRALMALAARLLAPGGAVLLHTPNASSLRSRLHGARWNMRIPDYHLHLATPEGIRRCAASAGLRVAALRTTSGTGREHGVAAAFGAAKGAVLSAFLLGNAIEVVAVR